MSNSKRLNMVIEQHGAGFVLKRTTVTAALPTTARPVDEGLPIHDLPGVQVDDQILEAGTLPQIKKAVNREIDQLFKTGELAEIGSPA